MFIELARGSGSEYLITINVRDFLLDSDLNNDDIRIVMPGTFTHEWTKRVPEELKDRIETLAAQQGVSINQFAMYAFTKEIGELETGQLFRNIRRGVDKKAIFSRLLTLAGAWSDDRTTQEIIAGLRGERGKSSRFEGTNRVFG